MKEGIARGLLATWQLIFNLGDPVPARLREHSQVRQLERKEEMIACPSDTEGFV
jgi:hypothetical protein